MKLSQVTAQSVVAAHIGQIRELIRDYAGVNCNPDATPIYLDAKSRAYNLNEIFGCEETARVEKIVFNIQFCNRGLHYGCGEAIRLLLELQGSL